MVSDELHPLDAAAAAYRRRAHLLGLTDVRSFEQSELDTWAEVPPGTAEDQE